MDLDAVLIAYDEQVRRGGRASAPGIERDRNVVRELTDDSATVIWTALDERSADAAIAAEIERSAARRGRWEWKLYSYDRPNDLPRRLRAAGLRAEEQESVLVAEPAELDLDATTPEEIELVEVDDEAAVRALCELQDEVFGSPGQTSVETLLAGLESSPPSVAAVMALAAGRPVAGGRLELPPDSDFAGLWGGCTHLDWRRRGIFRALVAHRAALAAARGYRWLHVDASPQSRPILLSLGFVEIAKTTPFVLDESA